MSSQISVYISDETKERLERYSSTYGVKKAFLIESAINHHLQALYEIPEEFILSANIEITDNSYQKIINLLNNPAKPTKELRKLLSD